MPTAFYDYAAVVFRPFTRMRETRKRSGDLAAGDARTLVPISKKSLSWLFEPC